MEQRIPIWLALPLSNSQFLEYRPVKILHWDSLVSIQHKQNQRVPDADSMTIIPIRTYPYYDASDRLFWQFQIYHQAHKHWRYTGSYFIRYSTDFE